MRADPVTQSDVEEALRTLAGLGQAATARAVRRQLGNRGSMTTIVQHLRACQEARTAAAATQGEGAVAAVSLPDSIAQGLMAGAETYWRELTAAAEDIVADAQSAAEHQVRVAQNAAALSTNKARELEATLLERTQQRDALETAKGTLEGQVQTLGQGNRDLQHTLDTTRAALNGMQLLAEERKHQTERQAETLANLESDQRTLNQSRVRLQQIIGERDTEIMALQNQVSRLKEDEQRARQDHATTLASLRGELNQAQALADAHKDAAARSDAAMAKEQEAHRKTAGELATFRERTNGLASALESAQVTIEAQRTALSAAETLIDRARAVARETEEVKTDELATERSTE